MTSETNLTISPDDPVFDAADSDPSVSPADDFYRFVNGGWIDTNPVPEEYGAWGAAQEVHERNEAVLHDLLDDAAASDAAPGTPEHAVGVHFRSGMDTDRIEELGIEPIESWLNRIDLVGSVAELRTLIADLHRNGIGALFAVGVIPDFEDATKNLLYVDQGGLGLPDRDYYLRDDETSVQLLADYRSHVEAMFLLLNCDEGVAEAAAKTILQIETAIAELSYTNVQERDVDLVTNKYTRDDFEDLMPNFNLPAYLEAIGAGGEEAVNIDNEGYYPALDQMLETTSIEAWKTYLTWHLVASAASSLPERFEKESFGFYGTKLGGQEVQKARWRRVLASGSSDIGQLISQLFVRDNFTPESKAEVEHLVQRLFDAMRERLETITWMSDETRNEALKKLDGFGYKIGYPDEWRDYTGLELSDGQWLANRLAARRFEFDRQIGTLGQPVDPHEWSMAPHVVNAYYHPLRNEIVFPAGILQSPFYSADADAAVNYGAIGAVIGHEITHGFDDQGSRFDAKGVVRNWWSDADRAEFDSRAKIMIDQFNEYEIEDGLTVNGELTLGENIADLGGLIIALSALQVELGDDSVDIAGLSPEQRFFISWARVWRRNYTDAYLRLIVNSDPHSPSDLRCAGPMSNLASFSNAFGISADAKQMRPIADRVDIW